jgi:hypothetical protein
MKSPILLVSAFILASCAAPVERRITQNPVMYEGLTSPQKVDVRSGKVREGMSKDAVFLAWGRPTRIHTGMKDGKALERWNYTNYEPTYNTSIGFGTGFLGWGRDNGPCFWGINDPFYFGGYNMNYVPVEGKSVEFLDGKVSGFSMPR